MDEQTGVWAALGLEPTTSVTAIREAFASRGDQDVPTGVRHAYETALLWISLDLPLSEIGSGEVPDIQRAVGIGAAGSEAEPIPSTAAERLRAFWRVESYSAPIREDAALLGSELETLATAIERGDDAETQHEALQNALATAEKAAPELQYELELILPALLTRSVQPTVIEDAISRLRWRRSAFATSPLHQVLVGELLRIAYAHSLFETLRDNAAGWWKSWPRDADGLAASALIGGYRPALFIYASSFERVWFRMQQYWNDLTVLPEALLRQILGSETHDYWSPRLTKEPSRFVATVQALQGPVAAVSLLMALATPIGLVAHREANSATFGLAMLLVPVGWLVALLLHFVFFGIVWFLDPSRSSNS